MDFNDLNFEDLVPKWSLFYAEKNLEGDIPQKIFETNFDLNQYVLEKTKEKTNTVFLVSYDDEEFLTDSFKVLFQFLNTMFMNVKSCTSYQVFVFEFGSYEEAYKVALDMKETNPLCYEQEEEAGGICSDNLN